MGEGADSFLFSYHGARLADYKKRIFTKYNEKDKEEHRKATKEFFHKSRFWQANVTYHDLDVVMNQEIMERKVREYDLVDEKIIPKPLDGYEELFNDYIDNIAGAVYERGLSFVLYGHNEGGKTITAVHLLCTAIQSGLTGYYISFKDLLNLYNNAEFAREEDAMRLWRYVKDCDFLVIDEVGKESKVSENVLGVFEQIVKHRSVEVKPTVLVTNIRFPHDVEKRENGSVKKTKGFLGRYGHSIFNSLITSYRIIEFSKSGKFRQRTRREWF
jgi:DNA replication protein DnaC